MIDYSLILSIKYSGKQWALNGDSYEGLTWLDSTDKPTKEELDSEWQSILDQKSANAYKQQRATAYPSITDQLDTLYHGGYDAWKATITAVKEEFPKP